MVLQRIAKNNKIQNLDFCKHPCPSGLPGSIPGEGVFFYYAETFNKLNLVDILMVEQKKRYRATREVIESTNNPKVEHPFIKYPGREAEDITYAAKEGSTKVDKEKYRKITEENPNKRYTLIHTHPSEAPRRSFFGWLQAPEIGRTAHKRMRDIAALPSGGDMRTIIYNRGLKTSAIAVRDTRTGEVLGYNIIKKTKETPTVGSDDGTISLGFFLKYLVGLDQYSRDAIGYDGKRAKALNKNDPAIARQAYEELLDKYNLKSRFVPADKYKLNEQSTAFVPKDNSGLERKVAGIVASILLVSSIFFLYSNMTGNVIGINKTSSNWIGGILFVIGLVGAFFYFKKK